MKYAVVKVNGMQFKVSEGSNIEVLSFPGNEGDKIELKDVLLLADDKSLKIGKPFVKDSVVKAKIIKQFLGKKIDILKFKAKTGYKRKSGFRPKKTLLLIQEIV